LNCTDVRSLKFLSEEVMKLLIRMDVKLLRRNRNLPKNVFSEGGKVVIDGTAQTLALGPALVKQAVLI